MVLSQFSALQDKKTLADYFNVPKNVYPVGRLDEDSEGLLLLTNDSKLNNRLLNPLFAHEREYWAQVDGAITRQAVTLLQQGLEITVDGKQHMTRPCAAFIFDEPPPVPERNPPIRFRAHIPAPWVKIILTEGKNRQVRKMFAKIGFPVLRLIRSRIESLELGNMQPGKMISLSAATVYKKLFHE